MPQNFVDSFNVECRYSRSWRLSATPTTCTCCRPRMLNRPTTREEVDTVILLLGVTGQSHMSRGHAAVTMLSRPGYCAHCLSCCSAHTAHSAAVSCAHRGPACVSAARVSADWRVLCCEGGSSGQLRAADGRDIETVGSGCRAADSQ